ncbi:DUF1651 domain-containing protein [Synechococcus sp. CB0101]|jgi:hypothetical protein|uniref:DUF1651 domain-containing protein n=1 Tax=Synechococcus sp. CB0101 TaxID=232348 RepID=UPI0002001360|nr:DUF1651 domain-containing protein [Synechococcus sp. CB0101]
MRPRRYGFRNLWHGTAQETRKAGFDRDTPYKNGSHLRRDDARTLWKKLQADGWRQCTPQWGEDVDV